MLPPSFQLRDCQLLQEPEPHDWSRDDGSFQRMGSLQRAAPLDLALAGGVGAPFDLALAGGVRAQGALEWGFMDGRH